MWLTKTNLTIYCSHFLSCWGNRMWMFGMGMLLVRIADDSIQLSAIYGLITGLSIFVFGALVGDWVDNTPRLKAAQLSLVLQDALMLGCAAVITGFLWHNDHIREVNTWLSPLLKALVVFLGVLSNLASQARIIAVERDWIVEICGKNSDHLASMTAMLRRIDQISMILAPMATGQIMTYIGLVYGAIFIGSWNVLSVFVEFYLMWKVYNTVPALKAKKNARRIDAITEDATLQPLQQQILTADSTNLTTTAADTNHKNGTLASDTNNSHATTTTTGEDTHQQTQSVDSPSPHLTAAEQNGHREVGEEEEGEKHAGNDDVDKGTWLARAGRSRLVYQFVTLYRGFKTYIGYPVALPGLALAFLYMTVLGFDNITVAYAVTQGLSESVLGILMGSSAVFGILATFAYPVIRHRVGLTRTGFIALSCQVSCLTLCIVSIWVPGSPFDPLYRNSGLAAAGCGSSTGNASDLVTQAAAEAGVEPTTTATFTNSLSAISTGMDSDHTVSTGGCGSVVKRGPDSYLSVIFLMTGIFLARFGVWIADLTITQLFLEKLIPTERGIVNGVQSSLNQMMDLLKFVLVVVLPNTETFGFLIIISFCFIATAWLLYAIFARREGERLCVCGQTTPARETRRSSASDVDVEKNGLTSDSQSHSQ